MSNDKKLTFAEYLASKERLLDAVDQTPQKVVEYTVRRYCQLSVGLSRAEREHVRLKPNHTVLVEWLYDDPNNPTPLSLKFETDESVSEPVDASWSGERLLNWLMKNTDEN